MITDGCMAFLRYSIILGGGKDMNTSNLMVKGLPFPLIPQFGSNAGEGCCSTTKILFLAAVTCEKLVPGRCLQHVLHF